MAKKRVEAGDGLADLSPVLPVVDLPGPAVEPQPEPGLKQLPPIKYRVELNCPTPLAHKVLEIEARSEAEAREEFCRRNGISDSIHKWTITRIA